MLEINDIRWNDHYHYLIYTISFESSARNSHCSVKDIHDGDDNSGNLQVARIIHLAQF